MWGRSAKAAAQTAAQHRVKPTPQAGDTASRSAGGSTSACEDTDEKDSRIVRKTNHKKALEVQNPR